MPFSLNWVTPDQLNRSLVSLLTAVEAKIDSAVATLTAENKAMGDSITTAVATMSAELDTVITELTTIAAKISASGNVPQADIDAVNALATKLAGVKSTIDGMAGP